MSALRSTWTGWNRRSNLRSNSPIPFSCSVTGGVSDKCGHQCEENADTHGYHEIIINGREDLDNSRNDGYRQRTGKGEEWEEDKNGHEDTGKGPLP